MKTHVPSFSNLKYRIKIALVQSRGADAEQTEFAIFNILSTPH